MTDFSSLPSHHVNYPIGHFPVAPRQPVIPTAALAENLARTATDVAKELSPEQRKLKETQFALFGAKLRADNQEAEIRQMQIQAMREEAKNRRAENERLNGWLKKSFSNATPSQSAVKPPQFDLGDTHPLDYYGTNLQDKSAVNLFASAEDQPELPVEDDPANDPQLEEESPTE